MDWGKPFSSCIFIWTGGNVSLRVVNVVVTWIHLGSLAFILFQTSFGLQVDRFVVSVKLAGSLSVATTAVSSAKDMKNDCKDL
jgi:hypothetical protein